MGMTQIHVESGKRRAGTHRPEARKMLVFWPGVLPPSATNAASCCQCHRYPARAYCVCSISTDLWLSWRMLAQPQSPRGRAGEPRLDPGPFGSEPELFPPHAWETPQSLVRGWLWTG